MTKQNIPKIRFQGFDDEWERNKFGSILRTYSFKKYIAKACEVGEFEVIQQGDIPILGYSNGEAFKDFQNIVLFGDHTLSLFKPKAPFFIATDGLKILSADGFDGYYLFNILTKYKPISQGYKRHFTILKNSELYFTYDSKEQKSIGQLFRTLDELISAYKKNLENYQILKTSMLSKMFPKEGQKQPEIRLDGFEGDWEEKKFSDILKVNSGRDYKHLELGDIPVYGTGGYMLSVNKSLSDSDAIGIGRKGTIDKPFILKSPFWTVDTLFYVTSDYVKLNFLYSVFQSINWKKFDESTGVPSLSKKTIEKIYKLFPSLPEQEAIGAFFANLDETISSYQDKIGQLELLKLSLIHI